jgi:hypothetical protein
MGQMTMIAGEARKVLIEAAVVSDQYAKRRKLGM